MITPHHLIYNSAIGKKFFPGIASWAVAAGALFPDIWVWVFYIWNHFVLGVPESGMWGDLYFKSSWNGVFCLAHSFWLLPLCIAVGVMLKNKLVIGFFSSALFHAVCDFSVHHDDAYRHFYPFSDWRFESPVSYWDTNYYGMQMTVITSMVSIFCLFYLQKTATKRWLRLFLRTLIALDIALVGLTLFSNTHSILMGSQ